MPQAVTKAYQVEYVFLDTAAKIPALISTLLSINYNIDLNAFRTPGVSEVQTITVAGSPGPYTITAAGQTTTTIADDASAATMQAALEALGNIGPGNITVNGPVSGVYTIVFQGTLGAMNIPLLTTSNPAVTTQTVTPGSATVDNYKMKISKSGANTIETTLGRYVVWDNGILYDMSPIQFTARYTP